MFAGSKSKKFSPVTKLRDKITMKVNQTSGEIDFPQVKAGEEDVELEGKPIRPVPGQKRIVKQGTQFCVESDGIDKNFGCYPSQEQADAVANGRSFIEPAMKGAFGLPPVSRSTKVKQGKVNKGNVGVGHRMTNPSMHQGKGMNHRLPNPSFEAGGPGSGCRGPNCGRPHGDVVNEFAKTHGMDKLIPKGAATYGDTKWNPEKFPVHALFDELGAGKKGFDKLHMAIAGWAGGEKKDIAAIQSAAKEVMRGKPTSPLAKALAVMKAVSERYYGNRTVTLYRGLAGKDAEKIASSHKQGHQLNLKMSGLTSFTQHKGTAIDFAKARAGFLRKEDEYGKLEKYSGKGVVLKVKVPASQIWFSAFTHPAAFKDAGDFGSSRGYLSQREFVIGSSGIKAKISRLYSYADYGEPMAGALQHAHLDTNLWFHPPSLKNADKIPTDDPKEKDDRFLDVTKRKQAHKDRMKILKRSAPGGLPAMIPAHTTLLSPHQAAYTSAMMSSISRKRRNGGMFRAFGAAKI